jgi:hypothetical protein
MPIAQLNNNQPHKIFSNPSKTAKNHNRKTARVGETREVGQDKGHSENAPSVAVHAAPLIKGGGARALDTRNTQKQKTKSGRVKLVHSTFHAEPRVYAELLRLAGEQGLSFSQTVNAACRFYTNATIEQQHAESLRDVIRQIIREELQVFGHRIIYFLMRIAFSAEQAKLLITNVLKFVLKLVGLDQKTYFPLVDESAKRAKSNILANTPQLKALLAEWEAMSANGGAGKEGTGK